jgi:hypothetical protein
MKGTHLGLGRVVSSGIELAIVRLHRVRVAVQQEGGAQLAALRSDKAPEWHASDERDDRTVSSMHATRLILVILLLLVLLIALDRHRWSVRRQSKDA